MSHYPEADPETTPTLKRLRAVTPSAILEVSDHRGDLSVRISRDQLLPVLTLLRDDPALRYDLLVDICGVDWPERELRFDVVYHLYSLSQRHRVRVKVGVPEDDAVVDTAVPVWKGADWFERECYDLLGVKFRGHPDLRRILTHDDFQGHALRKDYDQRQRWRCTRVSDLDQRVEVPPAKATA